MCRLHRERIVEGKKNRQLKSRVSDIVLIPTNVSFEEVDSFKS